MKIICADASPIALARVWRLLRKLMPEAEITCCITSQKALANARKKGCDILITCIDFGSMREEGILLAEEIKELCPRVNIIFATAASEGEYTSRILKVRYSGFLNKPYTEEELRTELENLRYITEEDIEEIPGIMAENEEL